MKQPLRCGILAGLCWLYLLAVVGSWLLLRLAGDRWWVATPLLFGPRWLLATPLALLIPAAMLLRRRSLWVLLAATLIVLMPVMGLCLPWRALAHGKPQGPALRVLTFNTHYRALDVDGLTRLIAETDPDIVALQEWSRGLQPAILGIERRFIHLDGEFCIASRYPLRPIGDTGSRRQPWAAKAFEVTTPAGIVHFFNVHLASPHDAFGKAMHQTPGWIAGILANRNRRWEGAQDLHDATALLGGRILLAGDFNLPTDSNIYRDALSGFSDAFEMRGFGFGMTYHAKWTVTRIDHILAGAGWEASRCWVGPYLGSPHRPVIADWVWIGDR